jgi:DNA-binding response OmpR family regulator
MADRRGSSAMADAFHGRHLLLVGDGSRLAGSLARSLQEQGSRVDQAHSLAAARCCLRSAAYDLLLLDAMLPDGDGLAFLGELRGSGNHVPVLVLATHIVTAEVVHGLRSGADDCLGRPFALDELLLRVAALLRRQAWTEPPVAAVRNAAFGGNRVDLATGLAETPHGRLRLSETELRLLRYFEPVPSRLHSA